MPAADSQCQVDEGTQLNDSLLKSGCCIEPSESCDTETPVAGTPNYPRYSISNGADVVADSVSGRVTDSNGTEVPEAAGLSSAEDLKGRRRIRSPANAPDWLPEGWIVEDRVRTSGASAGTVNKYYRDPVARHVFRSKNEVLHYVQTGTRLKRKKNTDEPDCETTDVDGSRGQKQKKAAAPLPLPTLDFDNVPTVTWVLKNSSKDSWVPHVDDHEVSKSVQQLWSAAFSWITSKFR